MSTSRMMGVQALAPVEPPAGYGRRLVAYVLDGLAATVFGGVLIGIALAPVLREYLTVLEAAGAGDPDFALQTLDAMARDSLAGTTVVLLAIGYALLFAFAIFQWWFEGRRGYTVGKLVLGIRTVDAVSGKPAGMWRIFLRRLVFALSGIVPVLGTLLMGLSPLFDGSKRNRGWHDKAAGTIVVDAKRVATSSGAAGVGRVDAPRAKRDRAGAYVTSSFGPPPPSSSTPPAYGGPPAPPAPTYGSAPRPASPPPAPSAPSASGPYGAPPVQSAPSAPSAPPPPAYGGPPAPQSPPGYGGPSAPQTSPAYGAGHGTPPAPPAPPVPYGAPPAPPAPVATPAYGGPPAPPPPAPYGASPAPVTGSAPAAPPPPPALGFPAAPPPPSAPVAQAAPPAPAPLSPAAPLGPPSPAYGGPAAAAPPPPAQASTAAAAPPPPAYGSTAAAAPPPAAPSPAPESPDVAPTPTGPTAASAPPVTPAASSAPQVSGSGLITGAPDFRPGLAPAEVDDLELTRLVVDRADRRAADDIDAQIPPSATLRLSDGKEVTLTGTVLVGRNPSAGSDEQVDELIRVSDPGRSVSKTHLLVGVDAEGVWVVDRASTNGTFVTLADGQQIICAAHQVVRLPDGACVSFGDYSINFDYRNN